MTIALFERHATRASVVPVARTIVLPPQARALPNALVAPASASAFLLESTMAGDGWEPNGLTLLGFRPRGVWRAFGHRVEVVDRGETSVREEEQPLASLWKRLGQRPRLPGMPNAPRFMGGAVGYIGWGAVQWFEPRVPARHGRDPAFPDAEMLLVDDFAAIDWKSGTAQLVVNVEPARFADTKSAYAEAEAKLARLEADLLEAPVLGEPAASTNGGSAGGISGAERDAWGQTGFEAAVTAVLAHLRAGDCMQAVLSRRLTTTFSGEPLELYECLREASPVPYHFLVRIDDASGRRAVMGASPELLLRVRDGEVTVRPIAGTRPRGRTPHEDAALESELRSDAKERAEHVMLVDLGRNDVGRVSRPGSVRIDEREIIQRFSHVMHMTSQVTGTLREGLSSLDALAAAFPAGTVSGAPKVRALEIIDALEPVARGPYGGAVGTVCYDGSTVMAIHLRSLALSGEELRLQAGAGIVSDSVPANEFAETEAKLAAVRAGLASGGRSTNDTSAQRWRRW